MSSELLCQAITRRTTLSFTHQGERYTVEPYSVGYEKRDARGQPLLLRARHGNDWRDFEVKFMSRIEINDRHFSADRQNHREMAIVLCNVDGKAWPNTLSNSAQDREDK